MNSVKPFFRADHIGSFLRTNNIKTARKKYFDQKLISKEDLIEIENQEINSIIQMQESFGFKVVTDGEFRRSWWHYDFIEELDGFELQKREKGVQFAGTNLRPFFPVIKGKLDFPSTHPMIKHFKYVSSNSKVLPKISIPGPSCCHFRTAPEDIHFNEYKDNQKLFDDISLTYKKAVQMFYNAGCRYLQMDDIFFAYLCDPRHRSAREKYGENPDELINKYASLLNNSIKDRPSDMTIAIHLCRGNFKSTYAAEGGYDPVADAVFNQTDVDLFFLEYDSDRAGGLDPLKYFPKGNKRILPGFISTKHSKLETLDELKYLFDKASKYVEIDQMGIAPQCGFASTEEGNTITLDDQKRKLELIIKTAEYIWNEI